MAEAGEGASPQIEDLKIENGPETTQEDGEDEVNPWTVTSSSAKGVDYDKLISELDNRISFI